MLGERVSETLRSVTDVSASTYILPKVRHPHHQRLCDTLPRATVWRCSNKKKPQPGFPHVGFPRPPKLSLYHARLSQDPVPRATHTPPTMLHLY